MGHDALNIKIKDQNSKIRTQRLYTMLFLLSAIIFLQKFIREKTITIK